MYKKNDKYRIMDQCAPRETEFQIDEANFIVMIINGIFCIQIIFVPSYKIFPNCSF